MKKVLSVLLVLCLALCITACGKDDQKSGEDKNTPTVSAGTCSALAECRRRI